MALVIFRSCSMCFAASRSNFRKASSGDDWTKIVASASWNKRFALSLYPSMDGPTQVFVQLLAEMCFTQVKVRCEHVAGRVKVPQLAVEQ